MGGRESSCPFHVPLENSDLPGVTCVRAVRMAAPLSLDGPTYLLPSPFPILPRACPYSQYPAQYTLSPFADILTSLRLACQLDSQMNKLDKMIRS